MAISPRAKKQTKKQMQKQAKKHITSKQIISIYYKLYKRFGPQHWWPVTGPKKRSEYEIIVGALLTQNTAWLNVERAIKNLVSSNLLDPKNLIAAPPEKVKQLIRPAGYYNQKYDRLILITKWYLKNKKRIKNIPTPVLRRTLLSLKGIGPETADSILLYAFGRPVFVVDAYTKRMLSRSRIIPEKAEDADYHDVQSLFHECYKNLPALQKAWIFREYHALIVELGKRHCKKQPLCEGCPILSSI